MSRGDRETTSGNLKRSMRDNYSDYGVDEYYRKVGATYRNPHFSGVRNCLFLWLNRWWQMSRPSMSSDNLVLFDMACGMQVMTFALFGEVTLAVMEWWTSGRLAYDASQAPVSNSGEPAKIHPGGLAIAPIAQRRAARVSLAPPIGTDMSKPTILAADPYTSEAFRSRTSLTCAPLSFRDIAEGAIPSRSPKISVIDHENKGSNINIESDLAPGEVLIEMVICSFALHLIETPSELFALLWELSTKARWLIILAPHKKPDIKDGWGWCKWDVEAWSEARVGESKGEYLQDRVHCRVYRSLNV